MERVDVAIVGAGVIGSATARALAARGVSAVLLEQFGPGHARGSSHGATRIFRLVYPDPMYVRMAVAAQAAWAALQADVGEELLVRTGGLDAGPRCRASASRCAARLWRAVVDEPGASRTSWGRGATGDRPGRAGGHPDRPVGRPAYLRLDHL